MKHHARRLDVRYLLGQAYLVAKINLFKAFGYSLELASGVDDLKTLREEAYTLRYPVAGTIDLFATPNFIAVELPAQNAVESGDKVYTFFWGYGPDKVRQAYYEGYPHRVGPPAMDVAKDGRIALMDPVNERVKILAVTVSDGAGAK